MLATKGAQSCGACSYLHVECPPNCFWAQYIKPGEEEKFSLLLDGTADYCFKARVLQESEDMRQIFIENQYEITKKTKREHEKPKAVLAADSESLNQHKGKTVVDVAEDSSNHCKWPAAKRARTQCTKSHSSFRTPIPLAENAVGPSEKVVPLAEKVVDLSGNALLLLAHGTGILEFADMFSEEDRTKILELKKHGKIWLEIVLSKIVNDVVQKAEQAKKEQASLRNEKTEQSEKEQASLRNEKAGQAEKEQAKRSEK